MGFEKKYWFWGAGAILALVLGLGALLLLQVYVFPPDFTELRAAVDMPIRLADGSRSVRRVGPAAPGWVGRNGISPYLYKAVVASEDTSFYSHDGIDVHEIKEAIKKDLKERRFARGASTLTQQLIKNLYLSRSKSVWRKVKEILLAPKLEKVLSKTEILTFYLNMAEWGPGIYGCGNAARYYFDRSPAELTAKQSAFLAMLLPSPRRYHAYFKDRQLTAWANQRVGRILRVMSRMQMIEEAIYTAALEEQLWGHPVLPEDAPGAPIDPGNADDGSEEFFAQAPEQVEEDDSQARAAMDSSKPSEDVPVVPEGLEEAEAPMAQARKTPLNEANPDVGERVPPEPGAPDPLEAGELATEEMDPEANPE